MMNQGNSRVDDNFNTIYYLRQTLIPLLEKNLSEIIRECFVTCLLIFFLSTLTPFSARHLGDKNAIRKIDFLDIQLLLELLEISNQIGEDLNLLILVVLLKILNNLMGFDLPALSKAILEENVGLHIHLNDLGPCNVPISQTFVIDCIIFDLHHYLRTSPFHLLYFNFFINSFLVRHKLQETWMLSWST